MHRILGNENEQRLQEFIELELHCAFSAITVALEEKIGPIDHRTNEDDVRGPFTLEQLLARMRSLLGRMSNLQERRQLVARDIILDMDGRIVKRDNEPIGLTKREFEILAVLMKNRGRVMTREMLLESIWGYDSEVDIKVVDVYVSYLRNKIDVTGQSSIIQTMRGLGYVIRK